MEANEKVVKVLLKLRQLGGQLTAEEEAFLGGKTNGEKKPTNNTNRTP